MEISQNEIDNLKTYLCNRVAHARYYANGVWTEINIDKINILPFIVLVRLNIINRRDI